MPPEPDRLIAAAPAARSRPVRGRAMRRGGRGGLARGARRTVGRHQQLADPGEDAPERQGGPALNVTGDLRDAHW